MTPDIEALTEALHLVLLFHSGRRWSDADQRTWRAITKTDDATTRVLCDHIRSVLAHFPAEGTSPQDPTAPP